MALHVPPSNGSSAARTGAQPSPTAATCTDTAIASARADHATWLAALATWREMIDRWEREHGSAVARLRSLQQTIEDHGRCLVDHRESFQRVVDAVTDHERQLATGIDDATLADRHQRCASLFGQLDDAQRRISRHHDEFMARMASLEEAAGAAL
jgi:hypothetical protein